jgi:shikimate kinase
MASLKSHALVVCLWASPATIFNRVRRQTHRPLLAGENPLEKIEALLKERAPSYKKADVLLNCDFRSAREVAYHAGQQFKIAAATQ